MCRVSLGGVASRCGAGPAGHVLDRCPAPRHPTCRGHLNVINLAHLRPLAADKAQKYEALLSALDQLARAIAAHATVNVTPAQRNYEGLTQAIRDVWHCLDGLLPRSVLGEWDTTGNPYEGYLRQLLTMGVETLDYLDAEHVGGVDYLELTADRVGLVCHNLNAPERWRNLQRTLAQLPRASGQAVSLFGSETPPPPPKVARLRIEGEQIVLDGEVVPLDCGNETRADVLLYLAYLIAADGKWVSAADVDKAETKKGNGRQGV